MKSEIFEVTFPFSSNKHANTPIKSNVPHRTSLASSPRQDPPERILSNLAKMLVAVIAGYKQGKGTAHRPSLAPTRGKEMGEISLLLFSCWLTEEAVFYLGLRWLSSPVCSCIVLHTVMQPHPLLQTMTGAT